MEHDPAHRVRDPMRLRQNDRMAAMAVKLRDAFDASRAKWPIDLDGRRLRALGLETIVALKRVSTDVKDRIDAPGAGGDSQEARLRLSIAASGDALDACPRLLAGRGDVELSDAKGRA